MTDHTGNRKKRPPPCVVTRAMADAGKSKLDTMTAEDTEDNPATDDMLVARVFEAMWEVYWEQFFAVSGKNLKAPVNLVLPPHLRH